MSRILKIMTPNDDVEKYITMETDTAKIKEKKNFP
jgi:hypothetical protein